jgi:hypothetical protein
MTREQSTPTRIRSAACSVAFGTPWRPSLAAGLRGNKTTIAALLRHTERRKMPPDQEFLLYPLDTGEDPLCPRCHLPMLLAAHEVRDGKPDFLTFRCEQCGRSEKFVCENDAAD